MTLEHKSERLTAAFTGMFALSGEAPIYELFRKLHHTRWAGRGGEDAKALLTIYFSLSRNFSVITLGLSPKRKKVCLRA